MLGAARVSARSEVIMAESDSRGSEPIVIDSDEEMPDGSESESSEDWVEDEEDDEDGDDSEFCCYAGVVPARDVGTRRDIHPESQDRKTFVGLSRMPGVTPEGNDIGMTGEGLFARRAFKCGEVVIEFVAPRIVREPRFYKMVLAEGLPRDVGIKMDKSYMVDDDLLRRLRQKQHQGLNSWYKMNCGEESFNNVSLARGQRDTAGGICQTLVFKAMRDIKPDEELTWKYDRRAPAPGQQAGLTPATKNMTPAAQVCAEAALRSKDEELEDAAQAPRARDGVPEASCERKRRKMTPSASCAEPEEGPQTEGTRDRAAEEAAAEAFVEAATALSTQDDAPQEGEAQDINAFNAGSGHAAAADCSLQSQEARQGACMRQRSARDGEQRPLGADDRATLSPEMPREVREHLPAALFRRTGGGRHNERDRQDFEQEGAEEGVQRVAIASLADAAAETVTTTGRIAAALASAAVETVFDKGLAVALASAAV